MEQGVNLLKLRVRFIKTGGKRSGYSSIVIRVLKMKELNLYAFFGKMHSFRAENIRELEFL